MNLNRAQLIGNLTRDPETKQTTGGATVCKFGVATTMKWKDKAGAAQERTEFHDVTAWGKLAEICQQYLKKGRQVFVEGRLQTDSWEKDGVKHRRTQIVAEDMIMLGSKPEGSSPAAAPKSTDGRDDGGYQAAQKMPEEEQIDIGDIPF